MDNSSDDFLSSFQNVQLTKKRFIFKKSSENGTISTKTKSEATTSPFFQPATEKETKTESPKRTQRFKLNSSATSLSNSNLNNTNTVQSKPSLNQASTSQTKKENFKSLVAEPELPESPDSITIKPKKFTFTKKLSSSSSSQRSTQSPRKSLSLETETVSKPNSQPKISESQKSTSSSLKLNLSDEVTIVSQTLNASDADYMDDDEFERRFGLIDIPVPEVDKLQSELGETDWSEDLFAETTLNVSTNQFNNRQDDSEEFRGNYAHSEAMLESLTQRFGLFKFRPHQREIINASLMQCDCFVLMPTGGGKSLCYQLPAILTPGVTIVISPLRALISDQVDKLTTAFDIPAAHLCSDVSKSDTDLILAKLHIREPTIKLLYLTPEKIVASRNVSDLLRSLYQRGKLTRFVIDEVHCLSQWGHDFRPDYKKLNILRQQFPGVPIMCLTATATKHVEGDVINILKLTNVKRFIRSFNRPNIKYKVVAKSGKNIVSEISQLIKQKFTKQVGIIYCLCRADCDNLAMDLRKLGIKAQAYHAGMSDKIREKQQRDWMQGQFPVIVATIAFGMGIDKSDVRFVIHNSIPKSVEAFYQESGRAGRDGEVSYSYLFYSYGDVGRLQRLMRADKSVSKSTLDGHFENLRQMVAFAENVVDCRRNLQLMHLGEKFDRKICIANKATICDNCENMDCYQSLDVTKDAQQLGQIVRDLSTGDNVTLLHVTDVYKGSKIKKIMDRQHNLHKYYGAGSHLDKNDIQRILKDLILKHVLADYCKYTGEFPQVYIKTGAKFTSLGSENAKFTIATAKNATKARAQLREVEYDELYNHSNPEPSSQDSATRIENTGPVPTFAKASTLMPKPVKKKATKLEMNKLQVACHEELLEECRRLAVERNSTLSSVMNLSAIKIMSDLLPKTKEECLKIQHVTNANYAKFGEFFLKITTKYREQFDQLQVQDEVQESMFGAGDWTPVVDVPSPRQSGVKRKSSGAGGYKKAKRYKKTYKKKGSPKKKAATAGASGWLRKRKGGRGGSGGGGLGLMPLHIS